MTWVYMLTLLSSRKSILSNANFDVGRVLTHTFTFFDLDALIIVVSSSHFTRCKHMSVPLIGSKSIVSTCTFDFKDLLVVICKGSQSILSPYTILVHLGGSMQWQNIVSTPIASTVTEVEEDHS